MQFVPKKGGGTVQLPKAMTPIVNGKKQATEHPAMISAAEAHMLKMLTDGKSNKTQFGNVHSFVDPSGSYGHTLNSSFSGSSTGAHTTGSGGGYGVGGGGGSLGSSGGGYDHGGGTNPGSYNGGATSGYSRGGGSVGGNSGYDRGGGTNPASYNGGATAGYSRGSVGGGSSGSNGGGYGTQQSYSGGKSDSNSMALAVANALGGSPAISAALGSLLGGRPAQTAQGLTQSYSDGKTDSTNSTVGYNPNGGYSYATGQAVPGVSPSAPLGSDTAIQASLAGMFNRGLPANSYAAGKTDSTNSTASYNPTGAYNYGAPQPNFAGMLGRGLPPSATQSYASGKTNSTNTTASYDPSGAYSYGPADRMTASMVPSIPNSAAYASNQFENPATTKALKALANGYGQYPSGGFSDPNNKYADAAKFNSIYGGNDLGIAAYNGGALSAPTQTADAGYPSGYNPNGPETPIGDRSYMPMGNEPTITPTSDSGVYSMSSIPQANKQIASRGMPGGLGMTAFGNSQAPAAQMQQMASANDITGYASPQIQAAVAPGYTMGDAQQGPVKYGPTSPRNFVGRAVWNGVNSLANAPRAGGTTNKTIQQAAGDGGYGPAMFDSLDPNKLLSMFGGAGGNGPAGHGSSDYQQASAKTSDATPSADSSKYDLTGLEVRKGRDGSVKYWDPKLHKYVTPPLKATTTTPAGKTPWYYPKYSSGAANLPTGLGGYI